MGSLPIEEPLQLTGSGGTVYPYYHGGAAANSAAVPLLTATDTVRVFCCHLPSRLRRRGPGMISSASGFPVEMAAVVVAVANLEKAILLAGRKRGRTDYYRFLEMLCIIHVVYYRDNTQRVLSR